MHRFEKAKQEANVVRIDSHVTVTYHKMDIFMTMFPKYFNDNLQHFRESLSPKYNRDSVFKAGEGAGRSGSFFFFSHDRKFIIKTMSKVELDVYLSKLPQFCEHFKSNKNSVLAKIFGVFTINTPYNIAVHVMLMENTTQLKDPNRLTHIFDLKGS